MSTESGAESRSVVAVIPARAGSRGVPGKNLRTIGGVSLLGRAVSTASLSDRIDRVIVSTDGEEIAAEARAAGAEVIVRPSALASDQASSESAIEHALDELAGRGEHPQIVVFMQATSPFTRPDELDDAVARVSSGEVDVVLATVESHAFLWRLDTDGLAEAVGHDADYRPRRQDREPQFRETGAFYVMDVAGFRRSGHRFFGRVGVARTDPAVSIDIDTEDDFALAEMLAAQIDVGVLEAAGAGLAGAGMAEAGSATAGSANAGGSSVATPRSAGHETGHGPGNTATLPRRSTASNPAERILVEAVVTDFDGVHTDDSVRIDQNGIESVEVNRRDGLGVRMLREAGIPVLILSTEQNPVVSARGAKLGVQVLQGIDDKASALASWAGEQGIPLSRVAYLGNDVNDLGALNSVGWPIAVRDAHPHAIAASKRVLGTVGGAGAVRELAELILEEKARS